MQKTKEEGVAEKTLYNVSDRSENDQIYPGANVTVYFSCGKKFCILTPLGIDTLKT